MPEMRFIIRWPDATEESCYSPSLIVKYYLTPGVSYPLDDFMDRSRMALVIASDRVKEKFGRPCNLALGQLARLEARARNFSTTPNPSITVLAFEE